jgi:hypothetical protein
MTDRAAWLLVLLGLAMIAGGCARPLDTAIATTNAAADVLRVSHAELSSRYREEQLAAARRVQGDRSDPTVRAEQRDRVSVVRERWRPIWLAYGAARRAWVAAVVAVDAATAADDRGDEPGMRVVVDALRELARTHGELVATMGRVGE